MPERPIRIQDTLTGERAASSSRASPGGSASTSAARRSTAASTSATPGPYVMFALFKRFLEHEGYDVTLVENITDINDKIYDAARRAGSRLRAAGARDDGRSTAPTPTGSRWGGRTASRSRARRSPRSSTLIEALIERGHAYASRGRRLLQRAQLRGVRQALQPAPRGPRSRRTRASPRASRRCKRDPLDFALWKAHKPGEDTAWESPWGRGRPGLAHRVLGDGGEDPRASTSTSTAAGSDLVFPHHENEIAQTEAGRGEPLARIWMHNGMIRFGEEKMAKSVGNITTLADALDRHGRDALIVFFLGGHYRQPLAYSDGAHGGGGPGAAAADRVRPAAGALGERSPPVSRGARGGRAAGASSSPRCATTSTPPEALAALFKLVSEGNRRLGGRRAVAGRGGRASPRCCDVLGPRERSRTVPTRSTRRRCASLGEREDARRTRDFDRADAVRDELLARGWEVRDTPEGPVLVPAE